MVACESCDVIFELIAQSQNNESCLPFTAQILSAINCNKFVEHEHGVLVEEEDDDEEEELGDIHLLSSVGMRFCT